jgi:thiosulfate/3-mercaptopyruvate sulfurtransferase
MEKVMLCDPDALVTCDWLEQHLDDEKLRIFDCSTVLEFNTGETPYRVVNCRAEHEQGHIPGAGYLDLQADFSRAESPFKMTLAEPEKVASAFERMGVGDGSRVVLYSRRSMAWAARFWWMLRWLGFDRASILDGGFERWQSDGRPVSSDQSSYPPGHLTLKRRPEIFVGKEQVLAAIDDPTTCTVNALGADVHSGENSRYGRPGHIPGSVNIPKVSLIDPDQKTFKSPEEIATIFASAGVGGAEKHIAYCGGGIFATVDAFWLHQLGHDNIAVYDNSMSEWATDTTLPIEWD